MPKIKFVPPGGYAGFAQQTPAVQTLVSRPSTVTRKKSGSAPKRRKKRVAKKAPARKRAVRRARSGKPARLVKGSAAAKAHMAKLRKMRKR